MIKKFTEEQRKEWEQKQKEQLKKLSEVITNTAENYNSNPEEIAELIAFGSQFYNYSYRNTVLIYNQNKFATYVQSYEAWKESGYPVKAGEKGIRILVPVKVTYLDLGNDTSIPLSQAKPEQKEAFREGKILSHQTIRFNTGYVYDISQTTCPASAYPSFYHIGYADEKIQVLIEGLKLYASKHLDTDIQITDLKSISLRGDFNPLPNSLGRYLIRLNDKLKDTEMLSSETHELGHAVLHRHNSDKSITRMELEADCFSIMLENHLGIEMTAGRKYHLASHYRKYQAEEKATLEEIISDVYQIYRKEIPKIDQSINSILFKSKQLESYNDAITDIHDTAFSEFSPVSIDTIAYYTAIPKDPVPQMHTNFKAALKDFINAGDLEGKILGYFDQRDANLHPLLSQLKSGLCITPESEILTPDKDIIRNPYDRKILESYYKSYDYMKEYEKELELTRAAQEKDYPPKVTVLYSDSPDLVSGSSYPISEISDYLYDKSSEARRMPVSPLNYDKIKFRIDFRQNGKAQSYEGLYNIGAERKSLINHIANYASKQLEDTEGQEHLRKVLGDGYVKQHLKQCTYIKNELVPYLKLHEELSALESIARNPVQDGSGRDPYKKRLLSYIHEWRDKLNNSHERIDALPDHPHEILIEEAPIPANHFSQSLNYNNRPHGISFNK